MKAKLLKNLRGVGKARIILTANFFCGCAENLADTAMSVRVNDPGEGEPVYELGTFEGLSAETEERILLDYFTSPMRKQKFSSDFSVSDFLTYGYFGTYNDYVMVSIGLNEDSRNYLVYTSALLPSIFIADWYYNQNYHSEPIIAWKNGQIYQVVDLYKTGNLMLDDLRSIANLHPEWKPISELRRGK